MKSNRSIVFTLINSCVLILLPLLILFSILYQLITSPLLYTTILKKTDLISTFITARNLEITQSIQDEIDKKVGLASYTIRYEALKKQLEEAQKAYDAINKTQEYTQLQQQYDEIKRLSFDDVKQAFPDKKAFEQNKAMQLEKIKMQIESIEKYRKEYKEDIQAAYSKLNDIQDKFEDAEDEYNDKQEEANEIIQKHRGTFSAQLNEDITLLKPTLTAIFNEKLIDGTLHPLIEKYIQFFTSYHAVKDEYILELNDETNPYYHKKVKQILLPDITISLWVSDGQTKRHLLSDIIAEEIRQTPGIKNRGFLIAAFKFADTAIGEMLSSRFLIKAGFWFNNGIIYKHNIILTGNSAEIAITIMKILSYGKYIVYATLLLSIAYIMFVFFSTTERPNKLLWLKRLLLYPSLIVIIVATIGVVLPLLWIKPSDSLSLIAASILQSVAFNTALCIFVPIIVVFAVLLLVGLFARKRYIRNASLQ